jgi:6-phosphogluconolactonase (cycloisomerase 2 family)
MVNGTCGLISGSVMYVLNEVASTMSVYKDGNWISTYPVYPPSDKEHLDKMTAGEIIMLGNKIIASNRDSPSEKGDAMAIFTVKEDGMVDNVEYVWPNAKTLRGMSASPDGKWICVAGRNGGGVVMLDRDFKEVARLNVPMVTCPVWMD